MSKLPKDFIRKLGLLNIFTPYRLWVETFSEIDLIRDEEEKILFLKKHEKNVRDELRHKGGSLWIKMKILGKIKSDINKLYEDQLIDFFSEIEFSDEEMAITNPVIVKVSEICNSPLKQPQGIIDSSVTNELQVLLKLPVFNEYSKLLPYLRHLDKIDNKIKALKNKGIPTTPSIERTRTKKVITDFFQSLDMNIGWQKAFKNENDYNSYCELLTAFFTMDTYNIPTEKIILKKMCKTKVARILKEIHFELSEDLKYDKEYHKIVRVLHYYQDLYDDEMYDALLK